LGARQWTIRGGDYCLFGTLKFAASVIHLVKGQKFHFDASGGIFDD
jgi:hypothetical protein